MLALRAARRFLTRFGMSATSGVFVLCLIAAIGGESVAKANVNESIPDGDDLLTQSELRWCMFESERLGGESDTLDTRSNWEIENYNRRITAYNQHCLSKTYYERDESVVERELTAQKRQALREDGAYRVRQARAEREGRRVYVEDEPAIVRTAPDNAAEALGRVPRWGELIRTGRAQGPWYEVEWRTPSLEQALTFGWVFGGLLKEGSGKVARFAYCEAHKQGRAQHGKVVNPGFALSGRGYIRVENGTHKDAYVKVIRRLDGEILSFFVEARKTGQISGVSNGSYELAYATGSKFSRGCDSFSEPGSASKFADTLEFDNRTAGYTLTLHTVVDGNAAVHSMSYDDFDML